MPGELVSERISQISPTGLPTPVGLSAPVGLSVPLVLPVPLGLLPVLSARKRSMPRENDPVHTLETASMLSHNESTDSVVSILSGMESDILLLMSDLADTESVASILSHMESLAISSDEVKIPSSVVVDDKGLLLLMREMPVLDGVGVSGKLPIPSSRGPSLAEGMETSRFLLFFLLLFLSLVMLLLVSTGFITSFVIN